MYFPLSIDFNVTIYVSYTSSFCCIDLVFYPLSMPYRQSFFYFFLFLISLPVSVSFTDSLMVYYVSTKILAINTWLFLWKEVTLLFKAQWVSVNSKRL